MLEPPELGWVMVWRRSEGGEREESRNRWSEGAWRMGRRIVWRDGGRRRKERGRGG